MKLKRALNGIRAALPRTRPRPQDDAPRVVVVRTGWDANGMPILERVADPAGTRTTER